MNLIFVRHGQSLWNLENKFTGWVDVGLSDRGKKEASLAGLKLKDEGFIPDICYTSYLKRSKDTANIILDNLEKRKNFKIFNIWELNERHYGALQGLDKIETAKKYGEDQVQLWRRSFDVKPPSIDESSDHNPKNDPIYKDVDGNLPVGESLKDVVQRVEGTLKNILLETNNFNILVVAHGNSIRAMIKILENISDKEIAEVNIPTGLPLAFNIDGEKIERIGYLADENELKKLEKEVEMQSKVSSEEG
jgi:2,3-bisphosphoglycerate-dependent phosphoglycerate mutase